MPNQKTSKESAKDLSNYTIVGIPAFNEQERIGEIVSKAVQHSNKVIVVDDCSSDLTAQIAKENGADVIIHDVNKGYGGALNSIFEYSKKANADILITMDGDGQHQPEEIPKLTQALTEFNADLIIGSRFTSKNNHNIPRYRKLGISLIGFAANSLIDLDITDTQSGFRAYSKKAINNIQIKDFGMGASLEILFSARKSGFKIQEIGISCLYFDDSSTLNPLSHGVKLAISLMKLALH
jgi:glycosyltransferase involved in cell wall biosynthesis